MTALHTLGILSTSFSWNAFLEGVPTYAEYLLAAFALKNLKYILIFNIFV
jgi:hypothetical protein